MTPRPATPPSAARRLGGLAGDVAGPVLRTATRPPARRTSGRTGRTHVEVRGMDTPERADARTAVVAQLLALDGVHGAVVNAVLGRVVVDHAPDVSVPALVDVVARVEVDHQLDGAAVDTEGTHPADVTPWVRQMVALGLDVAGLGATAAERWFGGLPVSRAVPPLLTAALSLADAVPSSRAAVEARVGGATTESWFTLGSATVQAIGGGPVGLVVDACYRAIRADEAAARTRSWTAWDSGAPLGAHEAGPVAVGERPGPLGRGPVERVGDLSGAAALAAFGAAAALVPERATAVLLAGAPKACRWGREAYAAAAHRALADGGVVVTDPRALRRADRVDVVVLDESLAGDAALVAAASGAGRLVVVGPRRAGASPGTADAVVRLQQAGHGVVLVSADDAVGLAAADVAVGLGPDVPWSAALRCADGDQARAVLAAVAGACAASRRAAVLALLGSAVGAPIALTSALVGLAGRTTTPVNLASLLALGVNTWAGRTAGAPTTPS